MDRSIKNPRSPILALLALVLTLPACHAQPEAASSAQGPESASTQPPPSAAPATRQPEAKGEAAGDNSSELAAFVGSSATSLTRTADLDEDGDLDAIAIVAKQDASAPRTLLILRRGTDGRLQKAIENPNAILAENRGGTMGDPLRDLVARTGGFDLVFEGGSREIWSHRYSFQYASGKGTWQLTGFEDKVLDRLDGTGRQRKLNASDFGDVAVAEFDPDALATD